MRLADTARPVNERAGCSALPGASITASAACTASWLLAPDLERRARERGRRPRRRRSTRAARAPRGPPPPRSAPGSLKHVVRGERAVDAGAPAVRRSRSSSRVRSNSRRAVSTPAAASGRGARARARPVRYPSLVQYGDGFGDARLATAPRAARPRDRDVREETLKLARTAARRRASAGSARSPRIAGTSAASICSPPSVWNAMSRLSAPCSSRTFLNSRRPSSSTHAGAETHTALLALRPQDRHARLVVRRADVDDQSAGQARDEPLVDVGDVGGWPVARHHDLAAVRLERVEDAAAAPLCVSRLPGEELHVVDQQHARPLRYRSLERRRSPPPPSRRGAPRRSRRASRTSTPRPGWRCAT